MASHNQFRGYIKLPGKAQYDHEVRFDFNFQIDSRPGNTSIEGFAIRMFTLNEEPSIDDQPEIRVFLSAEQFLDLIDSMRREFDVAQEFRKKLDDLNQ